MLRRNFLRSIVAALVASLAGLRAAPARAAGTLRFDHGVASGDPLGDGIVLWTRVSGAGGGSLPVRWLLARDAEMKQVVRHGIARTDAGSDYTVKADVRGLAPGTSYHYRFEIDGVHSPVGRTRTLPEGAVASARFAVVSCSNHPAGYFNVYRDIALEDDLDAVIHLGDYLYEYGMGEYATEHAERLGRIPEPAHEVTTLDGYRRRHAQYKADADSIAMHVRHPLIAVWDDHEIANDAWRGGAQNHQDDEGRWAGRRDAALRAYFEWMPLRGAPDGADTRIFRRFRYGDLMSLIMLDTRLYGRDRQPDVGEAVTRESVAAALADPERRLLGRRQERWLRRTLAADTDTTWQVIAQQVMLAPVLAPELGPLLDLERPSLLPREQLDHYVALSQGNPPMVLDTWNGYPHAREALLADLQDFARNPVVLSGDLHTSMASNVHRHGAGEPVTVEIMPPAVSSPGFDEYLPLREPGALREATMSVNPAVRYMDTHHRGWVRLEVTSDACAAEWRLLDTVHSRDYRVAVGARFAVTAGEIAAGLRAVGGE
ncbi:MAG TPA: alkaline phosphatase D family protein [Pelomicrobium sp.]|nr:alkaline phosphatase D family protein [Pelomicrobium sp.]